MYKPLSGRCKDFSFWAVSLIHLQQSSFMQWQHTETYSLLYRQQGRILKGAEPARTPPNSANIRPNATILHTTETVRLVCPCGCVTVRVYISHTVKYCGGEGNGSSLYWSLAGSTSVLSHSSILSAYIPASFLQFSLDRANSSQMLKLPLKFHTPPRPKINEIKHA